MAAPAKVPAGPGRPAIGRHVVVGRSSRADQQTGTIGSMAGHGPCAGRTRQRRCPELAGACGSSQLATPAAPAHAVQVDKQVRGTSTASDKNYIYFDIVSFFCHRAGLLSRVSFMRLGPWRPLRMGALPLHAATRSPPSAVPCCGPGTGSPANRCLAQTTARARLLPWRPRGPAKQAGPALPACRCTPTRLATSCWLSWPARPSSGPCGRPAPGWR